MATQAQPTLAFPVLEHEPPALEIRINFGVFAGRETTPAEIDDLAREVLPEVGEVSIVSEERHEIGMHVEASLHQVRIEVAAEHMPDDVPGREDLCRRLVEKAERWAETCIADRHAELTDGL
ncbi:MAG TPA: hypothetical protein VGF23_10040 [Gaiellaceae bacterium]|jgi:hypothetical protein